MSGQFQPREEYTSAHVTELSELVDRLKREHGELLQVLRDMAEQSVLAERERDPVKARGTLLHLRLWAMAFQEELERHSHWEEKELYPFLNLYFHKYKRPSVVPSLWMLEKEHERAMDHMNSFFRAVHALKSDSDALPVKRAAAYLTQACRILTDHLEKEEQIIFPLTDQVLTDVDFLFS
ncbi:hemerythrin domain-containing protein [Paenibacillus doosanensis]|uniref:Iron-sulfur cluster repair di-iron protein n=1 Tax=Paenibacillus konkukensis TaxID=2020716 RepID=A0ABY4RW13_9BACL|nr:MULTISPECIES: hemerythrin domain-containing protein [Paenibacillus]MCS7460256.1 hemerythrin domain-containing protein [Paenibacillus doosanensis]UQZ86198.1 iron-sulfur cluster repair di-iron protein [Paenibacillus konkukensis]